MIGDILREEREKQNISLRDVEDETSIRVFYLSSIEEGNYDAIPGEVYLRGFIKTYANFLKLDASKLLAEYKAETAAQAAVNNPEAANKKASDEAQGKTQEQDKLVAPSKKDQKFIREQPSLREKMVDKRQRSSQYTKLVIGGTIAVVILGLAAYWALGSSPEPTADKLVTDKVATDKSAGKKSVADKPLSDSKAASPRSSTEKADEKKTASTKDKVVTYQATYTDNCWSKVEADGEVILEDTVKKGTVLKWQAEKTLVITAGNAGALEIAANGKSLGTVGGPGEVVTKKFTNDKITP